MSGVSAGIGDAATALAARVVADNAASGRMLALAESCTGGMVAAAITDIAGSSQVLEAALVTYSNAAKQALLGVNSALLETFGAVSMACARAMAVGALQRSGADVAVAITGIAGPDGGTATKPVGTVVFARARRGDAPERCYTVQQQFDPDASRREIRLRATRFALELLLPGADALHPG